MMKSRSVIGSWVGVTALALMLQTSARLDDANYPCPPGCKNYTSDDWQWYVNMCFLLPPQCWGSGLSAPVANPPTVAMMGPRRFAVRGR